MILKKLLKAFKGGSKVVTRFAPSPTGKFHVGGVRTALYNYLYARKHGGKYILRCEDTDKERSKKEYEDYFLELFRWLGLEHDEYYRQSERTAIYKSYLEKLIKEGKAYVSKEEPKEEGQRAEVIRLKNPGKTVSFRDEVLGEISFDTKELGDFVIARDLESPLYHFAVVVDDYEMGITHVIRGQEHVSNTPRQILIQEAIGAPRPIYAHASVILNEERAKLSKRDPLVRPALEYRDEGYLPQALMNFMALLGWNPGTEKEVFTLGELVEAFSIERMQKPGAIFNPDKLEWINKEHMKSMSSSEKIDALKGFMPQPVKSLPGYREDILARIAPTVFERIGHFGEIRDMAASGDLGFYFEVPAYEPTKLLWKDEKSLEATKAVLLKTRELVAGIASELPTEDEAKSAVWSYAEEKGRGNVLWPLRFALSGKDKSPNPFALISMLGKTAALERIDYAIKKI